MKKLNVLLCAIVINFLVCDFASAGVLNDIQVGVCGVALVSGLAISNIKSLWNKDLFFAARAGNITLIKKFLKKGADVNEKNGHGNTPLHIAVLFNHKEAVQVLIEAGAEVNAMNNGNKTPLVECLLLTPQWP